MSAENGNTSPSFWISWSRTILKSKLRLPVGVALFLSTRAPGILRHCKMKNYCQGATWLSKAYFQFDKNQSAVESKTENDTFDWPLCHEIWQQLQGELQTNCHMQFSSPGSFQPSIISWGYDHTDNIRIAVMCTVRFPKLLRHTFSFYKFKFRYRS